MKQIFKELWIENNNAACLFGKALLLLFMIFGNCILRDYPYTVICTFMLSSFEIYSLKMYGQINSILPQTKEEKTRKLILKSAIVSGTYSFANTAGYVLLTIRKNEPFDIVLILFLVYMSLAIFLFFLYYRTELYNVVHGFYGSETGKTTSASVIIMDGCGCILPMAVCIAYIFYKFGNVSFAVFNVKNIFPVVFLLGAVGIAFLLRGILNNITNFKILNDT